MISQLTPRQQQSLAEADRQGRALVTLIDGRVALILPQSSPEETSDYIARIVRALERIDEVG